MSLSRNKTRMKYRSNFSRINERPYLAGRTNFLSPDVGEEVAGGGRRGDECHFRKEHRSRGSLSSKNNPRKCCLQSTSVCADHRSCNRISNEFGIQMHSIPNSLLRCSSSGLIKTHLYSRTLLNECLFASSFLFRRFLLCSFSSPLAPSLSLTGSLKTILKPARARVNIREYQTELMTI